MISRISVIELLQQYVQQQYHIADHKLSVY